MAIFTPGMICPICGKRMLSMNEVVMFPPFVPNKRDLLYFFSDGVFHRACFDRHPLSEQATKYGNEARVQHLPQHRVCVVCRQVITDPEDYFGTGYITSDRASPAYAFNYVQFHKRHFKDWDRASEFRRVMEELFGSEDWDGPRIIFEPFPTWER
jgi:hypothetical protein